MKRDILDKIKSRGYWQVIFRPKVFKKDKIASLEKCQEVIKKAVVELRGWDYPHFPTHNDEKQEIYNGQDYIESWIDWECFKEFWRIYQSGQYIHLFGMREDWYVEDSWSDKLKSIKPGEIFEAVHTIYRVTEIYKFLERLVEQGIYKEGVNIELTLFKTDNRKLTILDPGRIPLHENYISKIPNILFEKEYLEQDVQERLQDLALEAILFIFHRFNWINPSIEVIKNDQKRLLERKF